MLCSFLENVGPSIILNPKDTIATVGSNVSFYCFILGEPKPRVKWIKHGLPLTARPHIVTSNEVLTIMNLNEARDAGSYQCSASNVIGTIISLKAKLIFPCK